MRASYQFLGAVGFLFIAALVFSAMHNKSGFGTAADWAAAGANVAVVIVSLYLSGAEARRRESALQQAHEEALDGMRRGLGLLVKAAVDIRRVLESQDEWFFPEVARDYRLVLTTLQIDWESVDADALTTNQRAIRRLAQPRFASLYQYLLSTISGTGMQATQRVSSVAEIDRACEGLIDLLKRLDQ